MDVPELRLRTSGGISSSPAACCLSCPGRGRVCVNPTPSSRRVGTILVQTDLVELIHERGYRGGLSHAKQRIGCHIVATVSASEVRKSDSDTSLPTCKLCLGASTSEGGRKRRKAQRQAGRIQRLPTRPACEHMTTDLRCLDSNFPETVCNDASRRQHQRHTTRLEPGGHCPMSAALRSLTSMVDSDVYSTTTPS